MSDTLEFQITDIVSDDIPDGLNNVVAIAAGEYHSMALQKDGTVVIWGDNSYGQRDNKPDGLITRVP